MWEKAWDRSKQERAASALNCMADILYFISQFCLGSHLAQYTLVLAQPLIKW